MATPRQQAGIIKRKARAEAKNLVRHYLEHGVHENFGMDKAREYASQVPHQLGYQEQQHVREKIQQLFSILGDIVFDHGRGNTRDVLVRKKLAVEAYNFVESFDWE